MLAFELLTARRERRTLNGAADRLQLTLSDAYRVQDELKALYLSAGRRVAGYKLGYTSLAMRQQMGIDEPNFGPLYADMIVQSGTPVRGFTQPRVEPEIAVIMGADIAGSGLTLDVIANAVAGVHASLEIVDSVWRDYRFTLEQNTADGSSAACVVLGPDLGVKALACDKVSVCLEVNGRAYATATGAAAGGHPLRGVSWLCDQLVKRGEGLRAGQIVITGGLTAAASFEDGYCVGALFDRDLSVSARRAE